MATIIQRSRRSVLLGSIGLTVAPLIGGTESWASPQSAPGSGMEALVVLDHALFPDQRGALVGAVLGGLVLFAVTRNPIGLLAGVAGGAIVGGAMPAASRYVADRQAEVGANQGAVQNASLGDFRADVHHVTPLFDGVKRSHDALAQPLDQIIETLRRHETTRQPGPVEGEERQALEALLRDLGQRVASLEFLAGCAAKHRDLGIVYDGIGGLTGLTADTRFSGYAEITRSRTQALTSRIIATSGKLDLAIASTHRLIRPTG